MHFRNIILLLLVGVLLLQSRARAAISDPELDFINTPEDICADYGISKKEEILRLELDLTGNGKRAVFLTYRGTGSSRAGGNWTAYIPTPQGYSRTNGIQFREDLFRAGRVEGLNANGGLVSLLPGEGGGVLFRHMLTATGSLKTNEIMELDYSNPDHVQLFERLFGRKLNEPMPEEFFKKPLHQVIKVNAIKARAASRSTIGTAQTATDKALQKANSPQSSQLLAPMIAPERQLASTPSDEPTSSTPWSIIVILIVAAIGLLWLLVKNRK